MLYLIQLAELIRKSSEYSPACNSEDFLNEVDGLSRTLELSSLGLGADNNCQQCHHQQQQHNNQQSSHLISNSTLYRTWSTLGHAGLHVVVISGNVEAVRLLLSYGADPNELNSDGFSPMIACMMSCQAKFVPNIVETLIDNGADVNLCERRTGFSRTPLHIASQKGMQSVVDILLEAGADPNRKETRANETPLQLTLKCLRSASPENKTKYIETALTLLRYSQVDVLNEDTTGLTPLASSVMSAQPSVISTVISRGNTQFDRKDLQQAIFLMEHYDTSHDRDEILGALRNLVEHRCSSLQDLARRSIRATMPRRLSLVKDLQVPSTLKEFLLHKDMKL